MTTGRRWLVTLLLFVLIWMGLQGYTAWTWGEPGYRPWAVDAVGGGQVLTWVRDGMRYSEGMEGRYPPVHKYLLAGAYVPAVAYHWWQGELPSTNGNWQSEVPLRTSLIRVGRLVTVVMGAGVLLLLYRLGQMLGPPGAGLLAVGLWAGMYSTAYYSLTTNLDVPYLFWWLLAIYGIVLVHRGGGRWAVVLSAAAAALAVGTKDQAAGVVMPLAVMLLWRGDVAADGEHADVEALTFKARLRMLAMWLVVAAGVYLVVSQAIVRPGNYWVHVQTLFSDALLPYREAGGAWVLVQEYAESAATMVHPLLGVLILAGMLTVAVRRPALTVWLLLPAVCFTLLFIVPSRLVAARFLLPHAATGAIIAGIGGAMWLRRLRPRTQYLAASAMAAICLMLSVGLHLMLWQDSRGEADRWLAGHSQVIQSLGTYCTNDAHLPLLAQQARKAVYRAGGLPGDSTDTYLIFCEGICYLRMMQQPNDHARQHWRQLLDGQLDYQLVQAWQPAQLPWLWRGLNTRPLDVPALQQTIRLYAKQSESEADMSATPRSE